LVEIFNNLQLVARGQYLVEIEIDIPYYLQRIVTHIVIVP